VPITRLYLCSLLPGNTIKSERLIVDTLYLHRADFILRSWFCYVVMTFSQPRVTRGIITVFRRHVQWSLTNPRHLEDAGIYELWPMKSPCGDWRYSPRAGLGSMEKCRLLTLPELELQPLCSPTCSQSQYRLRYRGSGFVNDLEGSGRGLIEVLSKNFSWKHGRKPKAASVMIGTCPFRGSNRVCPEYMSKILPLCQPILRCHIIWFKVGPNSWIKDTFLYTREGFYMLE
jgi:hypothetical protein